jgi:hypothetical protein
MRCGPNDQGKGRRAKFGRDVQFTVTMQNQKAIKTTKLIIMFIAATVCSYLPEQRANAGQDQPRKQLEFVGFNAPYETRAGVDDGAAFAVHFIGSTHGSLEPCG